MNLKKLPNRWFTFAMVMMIAALSGCLKIPPSGVTVKSATADLVFGVPPLVEDAPPPGFEQAPEEVFTPPPPAKKSFTPQVTQPKKPEFCPVAADQTFPEEPASVEVKGRPTQGWYLWKMSGRDKEPRHPTIDLGPFWFKAIGASSPEPGPSFEFTAGEVEFYADSRGNLIDAEFIVQTFSVVQKGTSDDGIYLSKVVRYRSPEDNSPLEFRPEPKILLARLPIKVPMEIKSAGVDPDTLAALTLNGTLRGRQRVDVCGKVIDSWFFDGDMQFTSATGANFTKNYDYSIATQFGGSIVAEHIESPITEAPAEPHLLLDMNIGSLEPRDIPAELRRILNR